jgi:hypothetical protein
VALRKTRQLKTRTTAKLTRLLHELSSLARTKNHDLCFGRLNHQLNNRQDACQKILTLFLPSDLLKKDKLTLTNVSTGSTTKRLLKKDDLYFCQNLCQEKTYLDKLDNQADFENLAKPCLDRLDNRPRTK